MAALRVPRCRSCGAEVQWVVMHPSGKRNPLDPAPDRERGNIVICDTPELAEIHSVPEGRGVAFPREVATAARGRGVDLFVSHFATCPSAASHRKKRRG